MKKRWPLIALGVSLLLNVVLAIGWFSSVFSEAVLASDNGSTFRYLAAERVQAREMREAFCAEGATADRSTLTAWAVAQGHNPHDKDGLTWLGDLGFRFSKE